MKKIISPKSLESIHTMKLRKIYHDHLFPHGKYDKTYSRSWFKTQIKAHLDTINIYLNNFNEMFESKFGIKKEDKKPEIRELVRFLKKNKEMVIEDFIKYLESKTHYSYEINGEPDPLMLNESADKFKARLLTRDEDAGKQSKLGQFVILILSEYIILHNRMWCSGLKPKGINTIDEFLEEIK